jgi:DNA-binding transcriptional ArsR family regulator
MQPLVQLAQALADETRLRLLTVLLDSDATVSDLVTRLGVPQPRVSTHLAILRKAGLVDVEVVGRQRVYRPDAARVRAVLAALQVLAPVMPRRSLQATREVRRNTALRQARTCYDHLAGMAGVELLETLLQHGWIEPEADETETRPRYHLTPEGIQALRARGVDLAGAQRTRRRFAYGCLDWTERRPHLGGALAAAILDALQNAGVVGRQRQARAVTLRQSLDAWLGTLPTPSQIS